MSAEVKLTSTVQHFAEIIVNGQSKGKRPINGTPSLREFATGLAKEFGIKSFNVTVDSTPVTTHDQLNAPVSSGAAVGVSAKNSRAGGLILTVDEPELAFA